MDDASSSEASSTPARTGRLKKKSRVVDSDASDDAAASAPAEIPESVAESAENLRVEMQLVEKSLERNAELLNDDDESSSENSGGGGNEDDDSGGGESSESDKSDFDDDSDDGSKKPKKKKAKKEKKEVEIPKISWPVSNDNTFVIQFVPFYVDRKARRTRGVALFFVLETTVVDWSEAMVKIFGDNNEDAVYEVLREYLPSEVENNIHACKIGDAIEKALAKLLKTITLPKSLEEPGEWPLHTAMRLVRREARESKSLSRKWMYVTLDSCDYTCAVGVYSLRVRLTAANVLGISGGDVQRAVARNMEQTMTEILGSKVEWLTACHCTALAMLRNEISFYSYDDAAMRKFIVANESARTKSSAVCYGGFPMAACVAFEFHVFGVAFSTTTMSQHAVDQESSSASRHANAEAKTDTGFCVPLPAPSMSAAERVRSRLPQSNGLNVSHMSDAIKKVRRQTRTSTVLLESQFQLRRVTEELAHHTISRDIFQFDESEEASAEEDVPACIDALVTDAPVGKHVTYARNHCSEYFARVRRSVLLYMEAACCEMHGVLFDIEKGMPTLTPKSTVNRERCKLMLRPGAHIASHELCLTESLVDAAWNTYSDDSEQAKKMRSLLSRFIVLFGDAFSSNNAMFVMCARAFGVSCAHAMRKNGDVERVAAILRDALVKPSLSAFMLLFQPWFLLNYEAILRTGNCVRDAYFPFLMMHAKTTALVEDTKILERNVDTFVKSMHYATMLFRLRGQRRSSARLLQIFASDRTAFSAFWSMGLGARIGCSDAFSVRFVCDARAICATCDWNVEDSLRSVLFDMCAGAYMGDIEKYNVDQVALITDTQRTAAQQRTPDFMQRMVCVRSDSPDLLLRTACTTLVKAARLRRANTSKPSSVLIIVRDELDLHDGKLVLQEFNERCGTGETPAATTTSMCMYHEELCATSSPSWMRRREDAWSSRFDIVCLLNGHRFTYDEMLLLACTLNGITGLHECRSLRGDERALFMNNFLTKNGIPATDYDVQVEEDLRRDAWMMGALGVKHALHELSASVPRWNTGGFVFCGLAYQKPCAENDPDIMAETPVARIRARTYLSPPGAFLEDFYFSSCGAGIVEDYASLARTYSTTLNKVIFDTAPSTHAKLTTETDTAKQHMLRVLMAARKMCEPRSAGNSSLALTANERRVGSDLLDASNTSASTAQRRSAQSALKNHATSSTLETYFIKRAPSADELAKRAANPLAYMHQQTIHSTFSSVRVPALIIRGTDTKNTDEYAFIRDTNELARKTGVKYELPTDICTVDNECWYFPTDVYATRNTMSNMDVTYAMQTSKTLAGNMFLNRRFEAVIITGTSVARTTLLRLASTVNSGGALFIVVVHDSVRRFLLNSICGKGDVRRSVCADGALMFYEQFFVHRDGLLDADIEYLHELKEAVSAEQLRVNFGNRPYLAYLKFVDAPSATVFEWNKCMATIKKQMEEAEEAAQK